MTGPRDATRRSSSARRARLVRVSVLLCVVGGCDARSDSFGEPTPPTVVRRPGTDGPPATVTVTDESIGDGPAIDGPVLRHPAPAAIDEGLDAEIRGSLELDGGCLYVRSDASGERSPVLWPAATAWDTDREGVVLPGGRTLPMGTVIVGGGGVFPVVDIAGIAGPDAQQLAARCVDDPGGGVAVLNNADSAVLSP